MLQRKGQYKRRKENKKNKENRRKRRERKGKSEEIKGAGKEIVSYNHARNRISAHVHVYKLIYAAMLPLDLVF